MQKSGEDLSALLKCPATGASMRRMDDEYVSTGDPRVRFPVEQGITRAFLNHDTGSADVTVTMQDFYSAHPFPNYDEMESVGSLVEKSLARGFPELLNRAIPPHARVLEVGCGTGQLGNFLSIANRRVLSVDMTWNSLLLAQKFKEQNGMRNVHFAQMNLFRLPLQPATFDVVICSGVLHHTSEPYRGFQGLTTLVKPGGILIIGLYNRYGRLQTRMRRLLAKVFGRGVEKLDPYLSGTRLADDKRRAWFMDQYKNPHESMHTMDEVLRWFDENGIDFVRGIPSTLFEAQTDSGERRSLFDHEDRGSALDRLLSQLRQSFTDAEGGLFIMIGRLR